MKKFMAMVSEFVLVVCLLIVLICAGCQVFADLWPISHSQSVSSYLGEDPNQSAVFGVTTIGMEKQKLEQVNLKHHNLQLDWQALMAKDNVHYNLASSTANLNITTGEQQRDVWFGPAGYLTPIAVGILAVMGGRALTKATHYSEDELQEIIKKIKDGYANKPTA